MTNSIITMVDSTTEDAPVVETVYFKESCILNQNKFMEIVDQYLQDVSDTSLDELKKLGAEIQTTDTKCVIKDPKAKTREFPGTTIFNLDYIYL